MGGGSDVHDISYY